MFKNIWLIVVLSLSACTKFVQVQPPVSSIASSTVYSDNGSAAAVMTGVYDNLAEGALADGSSSIGCLNGLGADELKNYNPSNTSLTPFYSNSLSSQSNGSSNYYFWTELYRYIFVSNAVLEAIPNSSEVTDSMKHQVTGEAKFMRAFLYFYATNFYGDVPLVTSTNYATNNTIHRSPQTQVYQLIIQDLKDAIANLSDSYLDASGHATSFKIRPNRGAAQALLARVYLYTGKYDSAEIYSTAVIENSSNYKIESDFSQTFLGNSTEAIWQIYPVSPGYNTHDGYDYVLTSTPGTGQFDVSLSTDLVNAFEPGDQRFANWVGQFTDNGVTYYFPYKYKIGTVNTGNPVTEFIMVLRLSEQYLIRAEARAQKGNITGSQDDINVVRARAGLPETTANDNSSLLAAVLHERQVELFTEWGHRWLDLKRTNMLDGVLGSPGNICIAKGGTWSSFRALLPIPNQEIIYNSNLSQNPGYN